MSFDPQRHHRRSIRLKGYDYTQAGAYFVTLVAQGRECLFGDVAEGEMRLNEHGRVVAEAWEWLAEQYAYVELDEWVVMPNHLHGIIVITDNHDRGGLGRGGSRTAPADTAAKRKPLGRLVAAKKTVSAKRINQMRNTPAAPVWQRNYYERIIRNERELDATRQYIFQNPLRWVLDAENPQTPRGRKRMPAR